MKDELGIAVRRPFRTLSILGRWPYWRCTRLYISIPHCHSICHRDTITKLGQVEGQVKRQTYTCNNINRNVNGTVIITVSNTSSLKSPSGSSSSTSLSISTISGGARSGSEDCGRLRSDGCRKGISVYFISLRSRTLEGGCTADVYVPVVDSGSSSIVTLAIVFVVWVCGIGVNNKQLLQSTHELRRRRICPSTIRVGVEFHIRYLWVIGTAQSVWAWVWIVLVHWSPSN